MRKLPRLSLICAGPISRTSIDGIPRLAHHLGPVKSTNLRVASRVVNTLKAGHPVTEYGPVAQSQFVLINAVTHEQESELIADMACGPVDWSGCHILLYDTHADSSVLERLPGASVASFSPMPGHPGVFLFEGMTDAIRGAQKLFGLGNRECVRVTREQKVQYLFGYRQISQKLVRLLFEADTTFRASGLEPQQVRAAVERFTAEAMNLYRKGVRPLKPDESPASKTAAAGSAPASALR